MMTASLVETATLFNEPTWLSVAEQNGEFLYQQLRVLDHESKRFYWKRSWQESGEPQARHRALAADLAHLIDAFTRLGEATGKAVWISRACEVADELVANYWDETNGGLFTIAQDGEQLIVRQKDLLDNATPSANSTAANALLRLGAITGAERFTLKAHQILRLFTRIAAGAPSAFGNLLLAVHLLHKGITEIAITGDKPELVAHVKKQWLPNAVLSFGEPIDSPLWQNRPSGFAFVCQNYVCSAPAQSIAELDRALATI
jgi:uncharacterized protein YyaL (SSP411 family)